MARKKVSNDTRSRPTTQKPRFSGDRDELLRAAQVIADRYGVSAGSLANDAMWVQEGSHDWNKDRGYSVEPIRNEVFDTPKGLTEARASINAQKRAAGGEDVDTSRRLADILDEQRERAAEAGVDGGGGGGLWGALGRITSSGVNLLSPVLTAIDKPRAAVVAGAKQLGEGLDAAVGDDPHSFGWDEFSRDVGRNMGVADVLTEYGVSDDLPTGVTGALGFIGDTALDPLTYVTAGATSAARGAAGDAARHGVLRRLATPGERVFTRGAGGRRLVGSEDVMNRIADAVERGAVDEDTAARLFDQVSNVGPVAAREIEEEIGIRSGVHFAGLRIPGSSGVAEATARATSPLRVRARQIAAPIFDSSGMRQLRLADPQKWIWTRRAIEQGAFEGTSLSQTARQSLVGLKDEFGELDPDRFRQILEGSPAVTDLERAAGATTRQWFDDLLDTANETVARASGGQGAVLPRLENYLPHELSDDFIKSLDSKGRRLRKGGQRPGVKRTNHAGKTFLGETLENGSIDEMHAIAKRVLGDNYVKLFKDDPWAIMDSYVDHLGKWVARHVSEGSLMRRGLADVLDSNVVDLGRFIRSTQKMQTKAERGIERAQAKQGTAEGRLGAAEAQLDEMGSVEDFVPPSGEEFADAVDTAEGLDNLARQAGADEDTAALQATFGGPAPVADVDAARLPDAQGVRGAVDELEEARLAHTELVADTMSVAEKHGVDPAVGVAANTLDSLPLSGLPNVNPQAVRRAKDATRNVERRRADLLARWGGDTEAPVVELTARLEALTDELAESVGDTRAAARAARKADEGAAKRLTEMRREVEQLRKKSARFERRNMTAEADAVDEQITALQRQIDDLEAQRAATSADAAVPDEALAADLAEKQERQAAARASGRGKAAADKAVERAKKKIDTAASNPEMRDLERRIQLMNEYGSFDQIPRHLVQELDGRAATDFYKAQDNLLIRQGELAQAQLDAATEAGYVSVINPDDGSRGWAKVDEVDKARAARARKTVLQKSRRQVERRSRNLERAVNELDRSGYLFDAAIESRKTAHELSVRAQRELAALRDRADSFGRARRAFEDEAEFWWSEADRLAKAAEKETDEFLAETARLESVAASQRANLSKYRDQEFRWSEKLASSRADEVRVQRMLHDQFTSLGDGRWMDPDAAKVLSKIDELRKPRQIGKLLSGYDSIMARWKGQALLSTGFHSRNAMGAYWNNWMAGVPNSRYHEWMKVMRQTKGDFSESGLARIRDENLREAIRYAAADAQVSGMSLGARDVVDVDSGGTVGRGLLGGHAAQTGSGRKGVGGFVDEVRRTSIRRNLDPTAMDNVLFRANFRTAQAVERSFRGPLYLDRFLTARAAGMTADGAALEARRAVAKYHFDYSDLATWERDWAKRFVPFYTWTRKNIPLQLEMLWRQPGRFNVYSHAKRNLEHGTEDQPFVPQYYSRLMAIRLPWQRGGRNVYFAPDLPFRDLGETLTGQGITSSFAPPIKTPLEVWGDKQFFEGIPLKDDYQEVPAAWEWLMPSLSAVTEGGSETPLGYGPMRAEGRWMMRASDLYKIEQAIPLLGRARRLAPSEPRYQQRVFTTVMSTVFGLNTMTHSEEAAASEMWRQWWELQDNIDREEQINDLLENLED